MIIVFEDPVVDALAPITMGRLACTVHCGGFSLLELLERFSDELCSSGTTEKLVGITRPYLTAIQQADYPQLLPLETTEVADTSAPSLLINARLKPAADYLEILRQLLKEREQSGGAAKRLSGVVMCGDQVAAILDPPWTMKQLRQAGHDGLPALLDSAKTFPRIDVKLETLQWPHEFIAQQMLSLSSNLEYRIKWGEYRQVQDGLFVASGVKLGDYLVVEAKQGPIVIEQDAQIGPYTLLRGPVYMGAKCRILEHAAIKDAVSLGHTTKIGGEVEASIVEPYSNKQHHGFLGHSYLGSWINLGAGTCNSDLKNTYGTVNMEYPAGKATTGMQFLGCVMGNYSKTAINTGIFTGKVIGACSMMYGFVTSNVPSFVNYARLFGQVTTLPAEVMVATQARMFSRRSVKQRPCDVQLIHDMYRLTQEERDRCSDLLSL
jgi:glucose-1-phosphate thymidylyltransferase